MQKAAKQKKMEGREVKPRGVPKVFGDALDVEEVEKKLLDRDPAEIAGQITLKDFEVLKKIPAREFLDQGWMKKNKKELVPKIMDMIDMYNRVSSWAQAFVMSFDDESKRLQAMRKVIYIAKALRELNNFSSLAAIYYGIVATPIHRLKCTKKLNKADQAMVDEMAELFKNRQKGLQVVMETATNPCVPHLSLYLGHLTFMDSNEDMIGNLINFRKRSMVAERIRWIKQAQQAGYGGKIAPDPILQQYIDTRVKIIHEDQLYQMSLAKEPQT
jgi:son of sevenless-like protein